VSRVRTPERIFILVLVVLLVVFRSAMFVFKPALDFDSDQAIFGLMGKHLLEGRAFPLFIYGQNYLLGIEAWLAAPMFFLFGVSVATLKLPMLLINVAVGLLLIVLLERELDLRPLVALVASLPFVLASPETSTTMLKTLGGTVEPLLYVLLLWMTRRRPVWFGLIAGIGFLNREFTVYGVLGVLILEAASGAWRRAEDWRRLWSALRVAAEVWLVVQLLKPFASAAGPGTTAADILPGSEENNFLNALHRLCFDPGMVLPGLRGLITMHWARLFGIEVRPLGAFGLIGDSVQGIRGAGWLFGPTAAFLLARGAIGAWRDRTEWRRYAFALYLILVGAMSAGMLALGRCGAVETLRYDLLSVLGAVGCAGLFFAVERRQWIRRVGIAFFAAWAAISILGHARIWMEYESHPPLADKMLIIRNLDVRGIRYASADYWLAYYITFMTNERTIVASNDFPRILEYGRQVRDHRAEAILISRTPCAGGKLIFEGVYFCPPE
jgi:hypothetical protein